MMNVTEDLDERLEQVGFAGPVLADKDIDKAAAIEAQGKIPEVLVLAYIERCQVILPVLSEHPVKLLFELQTP